MTLPPEMWITERVTINHCFRGTYCFHLHAAGSWKNTVNNCTNGASSQKKFTLKENQFPHHGKKKKSHRISFKNDRVNAAQRNN
jgi:hypothetical protein